MVLSSTSHGLETCNILVVLKQSSDEEVSNCCSESEVDDSDDSVSSVIKQEFIKIIILH
jgi:hypothetical protein